MIGKIISKHIKNNCGDGYVWLLVLMLAILIAAGSILAYTQVALSTKDIRQKVNNVTDEIIGNIKEDPYEIISSGTASNAYLTLSDRDVADMFAERLQGEVSLAIEQGGYCVEVNGKNGKRLYSLKKIRLDYISNLESDYSSADINGDGTVDTDDLKAVEEAVSSNPIPACDLNGDNSVDAYDVGIMKGYIIYGDFVAIQAPEKGETRALLIISFDLDINLSFGGISTGSKKATYSFPSVISFKRV